MIPPNRAILDTNWRSETIMLHQLISFPEDLPEATFQRCSKNGVPEICSTFTEEHPCRIVISIKLLSVLESLFNKVPGQRASNFIKKRLQHR